MTHSFNTFLSCSLVILIALITPACTQDASTVGGLVTLTSWDETVRSAQEHNLPIVMLVEQRNCGFCQALKKNLIKPLASDPEFGLKAIYVSMMTDYDEPTLQKDGGQISGFDFSMQLDASTTPTVLFFNSEGQELQKRVVGYLDTDDYSAALKGKIESAAQAVAKP